MSSAILLAKMLVLLMNVMRVEDLQKQSLRCNWVCNVTKSEEVVGTREQIGANFKFSKQVNQTCTEDTTVNSWDFIRVGIIVASDFGNRSEFSFSDFLTFGIEHVSPRQFLFGNENTDVESINSNVSCRLLPTSNETGGVASNGLVALYSPLFYLRNLVNNSQKTPYLGYVKIGGRFYLSAGFTNSKSPEYRLEFDQWNWTLVKIFSVLLLVIVLLCIPLILKLFCATIKTVQIERLSHATKEQEEDVRSEPTGTPTEQEESEESPTAVNRDTGKESLSSRFATKHGELRGNFSSWTHEDLELGDSTGAPGHDALEISSRLPNQENNGSDEHSEMVDLLRPTTRRKNPPTPVPEFSQTQFVGSSDHRASGSSSAMEEIKRNKPQTGVQHRNYENRKLDSVRVMDVEAPASPVGLRSFIANKMFSKFSNSKYLILHVFYQCVKLFILIMFPIFIPILIDVFVLAIPSQLFPRIASSLPSPFLFKSVFSYTNEVCPRFMYICGVCYIFRIVCFCLLQSSSNWVPSFLCRKHLLCFCRNFYLTQFIYPSNSWTACDECKEAPDLPKHCEIPVNIKCNYGYSLLEIVKKDWKDVSQNFHPELRRWFLGNEDQSSCTVVKKLVCFIISGPVFIFLVILDTAASLPIISLCYGRVWFTKNWSQNPHTQLVFFIGEFWVICFSVVWIVNFLFCGFLSMAIALSSFCIAAVNYPVEIVFYLAINIMVWHIIWSCYSSFTNTYDDLLRKLFDACSEDHESEFNQYKEENVQYIPEKLFTSACDKIKPVGKSFKKLLVSLCVWVGGLFFLLSFIFGSSTGIPISKVLAGTTTLLVVVHPSLWDFLLTRGKKEERKDAVLKKKVKGLVDAFFKGKLD